VGGRVQGKVAIVTGAAQGLGKGLAMALAREGANVVVADIQDAAGNAVVTEILTLGAKAEYVYTDVESEQQCASLIDRTLSTFGRLDVLVNNVGWYPRATLEETTTEFWEKTLRINLRSAFYCSKYAIPAMRQVGGGSILNIGSIAGIQALPNLIAYGAAKGGLLALTKTLAGTYAKDRIRVNYIIPGWILTEGEIALHESRGLSEERLRQAGEGLRLGRFQTVEDTAYAVIYLASDESAQITGSVLHLDAGSSTLPLSPGHQDPE
jgi:NAD(P)-dependent dehydrogenase (short-subunit alcohol dehydrogenase family)